MQKLLVLGGAGYLGRKFINACSRDFEILAPTRRELDLACEESISRYCGKLTAVATIVNFAVYQKTGDHLVDSFTEILCRNHVINSGVHSLWKRFFSGARMISMGASCAYSADKKKSDFEGYTTGKLSASVESFALSKRQFAIFCDVQRKRFGMKYSIIIPGTLFGPGEQLDSSKKHFVNGALYRAAYCAVNLGRPFEVFGDMQAVRDLSIIDNVVSQIRNVVKDGGPELINLEADYRVSVGQVYAVIEELLNTSLRFVRVETSFVAQKFKSINQRVKMDLSGGAPSKYELEQFANILISTFKYYLEELELLK